MPALEEIKLKWCDLDINTAPYRLPMLKSSSECERFSLPFRSLTSLCLQVEHQFRMRILGPSPQGLGVV